MVLQVSDFIELVIFTGASDFNILNPLSFANNVEICLYTLQDFICLEYNDIVILTFTPNNFTLIIWRLKESMSETLQL